MEEIIIIEILKERGYDSRSAGLVSKELLNLASPLDAYFNSWLKDCNDKHDFQLNGFSLSKLMEERKMTYPAALLTMDWIIKDSDHAIKSLKRGIK